MHYKKSAVNQDQQTQFDPSKTARLLTSPSDKERIRALQAIGQHFLDCDDEIFRTQAAQTLARMVFDPHPHVRWAAAVQMAKTKIDPAASLKSLLTRQTSINMRLDLLERFQLARVILMGYTMVDETLHRNVSALINAWAPTWTGMDPKTRCVYLGLCADVGVTVSWTLNDVPGVVIDHVFKGDAMNRVSTGPSFEKLAGMLLGLAIGDALGAPVEFLPLKKLLADYGIISNYVVNPKRKFPLAGASDDTIMTLATLDALQKNGRRYDPDIIATRIAELIRQHDFGEKSPSRGVATPYDAGYGMRTIIAGRDLYTGVHWSLMDHPNPTCGGAMRVTPFAVLNFGALPYAMKNAVIESVRMTHHHPDAVAAALVVAYIASTLLKPDAKTPNLALIDGAHAFFANMSPAMSERLDTLKTVLNAESTQAAEALGISGHAIDTVCFALYAFFKHPDDYLKMVQTCIMIDKGDADSIAAIAGAWFGALHGMQALPKDLVDSLQYKEACLQAAREWVEG